MRNCGIKFWENFPNKCINYFHQQKQTHTKYLSRWGFESKILYVVALETKKTVRCSLMTFHLHQFQSLKTTWNINDSSFHSRTAYPSIRDKETSVTVNGGEYFKLNQSATSIRNVVVLMIIRTLIINICFNNNKINNIFDSLLKYLIRDYKTYSDGYLALLPLSGTSSNTLHIDLNTPKSWTITQAILDSKLELRFQNSLPILKISVLDCKRLAIKLIKKLKHTMISVSL